MRSKIKMAIQCGQWSNRQNVLVKFLTAEMFIVLKPSIKTSI